MKLSKEPIIWILVHLVIFLVIIFFNNQFTCDYYCEVIGWLLIVAGIIIWFFGKIAMGRIVINIIPEKFVTKGIYSKIRHPLYLGIKIILIGFTISFKSIIGLISVFVILIPWHIYRARREEQELIKKFGNKYIEYKKKTLF